MVTMLRAFLCAAILLVNALQAHAATVTNVAPTVSITAPANNTVITAPAKVNLTTTAADNDGTITKVEFYRGATLINTDTVAPYAYIDPAVAAGTYSYTAKAYDNSGGITTSAAVTVISNAAPTVSITAPANNTVLAAPANVALTATAADSGGGTITKVEFYRGAILINTDTTAPYSFTDPNVASGTYSYTAKAYDNNSAITTSAAVTVISNAAPTVSITAPANNTVLVAPANVALTATAADSGGGTIAKVEFYRGATLINTDTTAPYAYSDPAVAAGTYSYTAKAYDNNGGITTSLAVTVISNAAPTVSITAPVNNTVLAAPANVALTATAADSGGGTITKVELYRGATLINTDTIAPYSYTDANVAAGTYSYTAKAYDNNGGITTSAAVMVISNALPTVSITAPANNTVLAAPANVVLTATTADSSGGTITKVEFYRGATLIATVTGAPYTATDAGLTSGFYIYTAKAYDNNGGITTSTAVTVISDTPPTVSITSPATGATFPAPASIPITATASDADGTISKVEFYDGATLIGTVTAKNPDTVWVQDALPAGSTPTGNESWNWVSSNPTPFSGTLAHQSALLSGTHQHYFTGASSPLNVGVGDTLFAYVYLDSANPPSEVMLQWNDGTWEHRAYWGANLITFGTNGTASRRFMGALPATGQWVRLEAPAALVGLEGRPVNGMAFTLFHGRAAWDYAGKVAVSGSAPYTFNWTGVAAGSYTLTARAYDNRNVTTNSTASSITVSSGNVLPTVSITAPANNTVLAAPANVALTATAADSGGGTITKVEFYRGATLINTDTVAPYSYIEPNVAAGTYSYTAKAYDNNGGITTSAAVTVISNALPTVSITAPANNTVLTAPANIALTATATDSGGGTIAKVEFYRGATLINTDTAAPHSFTDPNVVAGAYSYTAKAYDNNGGVTTSPVVNVTVTAAVAQIYYVHPDHLNTPRLITNQAQQVVWRWDQGEPFGNTLPNENPSGLGTFTCNLRFPGQYFDKETNTHHNYFRDYDPAIGRYIQSDPIGLQGGINTYLYATDPLTQIDPLGLMGRGSGVPSKSVPRRSSLCGTGGLLRGPEFQFREACAGHDNCFDTCGRTKADCDDAFCRKAKDSCPPGDFACRGQAAFYCSILQSTPAWVAYDPAQKAACANNSCKPN